jgi:hypothetical protein
MFRSLQFKATGHDIFDFYIVLCYCTCSDLYNIIVRMNVKEFKLLFVIYNLSIKLQGSRGYITNS